MSIKFNFPQKPAIDGIEDKLISFWNDKKVYQFKNNKSKENTFSIDTPPPTASGSLHIGHVFSYTHTDIIARYKRMCGYDVFYPIGWDDNGLPTERRVQNYYGVTCDPKLPYNPDYKPKYNGDVPKNVNFEAISRKNFIRLCLELSQIDEKVFQNLFQKLGLSLSDDNCYRTISDFAIKKAQQRFLDNLKNGDAYRSLSPVLWDITFQTAVAQAEVEVREYQGNYHRLTFLTDENEPIFIDTTRPELLMACVAILVNPDDDRFSNLVGKQAITPYFNVKVPILSHKLVEKDKGTGIVMCCTYGDTVDVIWQRELKLDIRQVLDLSGRIVQDVPTWLEKGSKGAQLFDQIKGKTVFSARQIIVDELTKENVLVKDEKTIVRAANFYEKGSKPLEIIPSMQWYIKNGSSDVSLRENLLTKGKKLNFYPDFMRARYEDWVKGLTNDWLISRQRFFGVPFPIWYRLDNNGDIIDTEILIPNNLPIDPSIDTPDSFEESQRDKPNGFTAEKDIMDTWATSSLTPHIANKNDIEKLFPMSLRPQGQDIIRTWLFSTILRSVLTFDALPWENASISGFILDPDRKKMSKSKGNVVTPIDLLDKYGSDGVRYWASIARLGVDTAFDENEMKIGRRLAIKILNASKFALTILNEGFEPANNVFTIEPLDLSLLLQLNSVIEHGSNALEKYEHSKALSLIETFFWDFCDDYVELIKERAYNGSESAKITLLNCLNTLLLLFSPYLPFVTDEVFSWLNKDRSIHSQTWPKYVVKNNDIFYEFTSGHKGELNKNDLSNDDTFNLFTLSKKVLEQIRKVKSTQKLSMSYELDEVNIIIEKNDVKLFDYIKSDIKSAGKINKINIEIQQ